MWPPSKYKAGCGRIWHAAWTSTILKHQKHRCVRRFICNSSITEIGTGCCGFWDVVELLSWGCKITFFLSHLFGSFSPPWTWNFNDVHTSCQVYHRGSNPLGDILSLHWSIMIQYIIFGYIVGNGWEWMMIPGKSREKHREILASHRWHQPAGMKYQTAVHIIPKMPNCNETEIMLLENPSLVLENITPSKSTHLWWPADENLQQGEAKQTRCGCCKFLAVCRGILKHGQRLGVLLDDLQHEVARNDLCFGS